MANSTRATKSAPPAADGRGKRASGAGAGRGRKTAVPDGDRRHAQTGTAPVTTDSRFVRVHNDPRFMRPRKNETKVKVDERFALMLKSEDFAAAPKVDKYGRRLDQSSAVAELKRFYNVDDADEDESNVEETVHAATDLHEGSTGTSESESDEDADGLSEASVSGGSGDDLEDDIVAEDDDGESTLCDRARGVGVVSSSEEDTDVEYDEYDEDVEEEEVPTGEETRRLAVVNMDWDKVKAVDLYTVFNGFKPANGVIKSVTIYPSKFGKERMEKEEREGPPREIFKAGFDEDDDELKEDSEEQLVVEDTGEEFDMVKLRKYQMERLRYFYAVIDCDSVDTASTIYRECDGTEYGHSANFFDLRFIPDDTTFDDDEPREVATETPENYRPREFSTDVLQHSQVKLTWDDDDVDRIAVTRRPLSEEEIRNVDFSAYLASSESEAGDASDDDIETTRRKYHALLGDVLVDDDRPHSNVGEEGADQTEGDMEITFAPGLSEAASALLKKKEEQKAMKNETSLDKYVRKMREKRKRKKEQANQDGKNGVMPGDGVNADVSDPYFAEEATEMGAMTSKKGRSKHEGIKAAVTEEEKAQADRQRQELELLVMGDRLTADERDHFDLKDVVKAEKEKKRRGKKGRKRRLEDLAETQDSFEIDVNDERFRAINESHHFAIDPTNPAFKRTKAMEKIMVERQNRVRATALTDPC